MNNTIDQQFIEYIVKSIVGNPDAVQIERTIDEKGVLLQLTVDPQDLGRVIGKRGAGAQALRTLLRALGTKNDARYNLKIVDTNEDGSRIAPPPAPAQDNSYDDQATNDTNTSDAQPEEVSEPQEQVSEPEQLAQAEEPSQSSMVDQTRRELEDLDDLDI